MIIKFVEDTHTYFLGDKPLISVTQLMQKHGLSPSYANVSSTVLNAKAERGSLIHKEIEDFNKTGEIGFTTEMLNFKNYIEKHNLKVLESELIAYNELVAGTVDLLIDDHGELVIADIKTTATLHKEAVSWQLSIYAYLLNQLGRCKGKAFHFNKEGELKVVDITLKPLDQVEKLLECERNNEIFKQELNVVDNELMQLYEVEALIKSIENQKKEAELRAVELRNALMLAMEENGVKSFENERIKLTYVDPTTRTTIDSTKLKKEMPEVAEKYSKTTTTKASLRITLKEEEE